MKLRFNGIIETRKRGCVPCGKARSELGFVSYKTYHLPSGLRKTFRKGVIEEVNDADAEFLLQYQYNDKGTVKRAFEVIA